MNAGITTLCASAVPLHALDHDCAIAAPTSPPISACDELDGSPSHHVNRFHAIAPNSAGEHGLRGREARVDDPLADRLRDRGRHEGADEVRDRRDRDRHARRQRARRDRGRDRVRRVVEAVREVEAERDDDHDDEEEVACSRPLAVLHDDRLEHVRGVLAGVDCLLEALVDVLPADHRQGSAPERKSSPTPFR